MNRIDFMRQLESLLQNISLAEREEALQYYNDYFNDAGPECEQDVIEALGNPMRVAETIKKEIYGTGYGDINYHKTMPTNRSVVEYNQNMNQNGDMGNNTNTLAKEKEPMPTWAIVLIVILCVFFSPAILGVIGGTLGTILGIGIAWFSLILAFGVIAVSFIFILFVFLIIGFGMLFVSPLAGTAFIGVGLVVGGLGLGFLMLTVVMAGSATPAIFKGIADLCRWTAKKINKK